MKVRRVVMWSEFVVAGALAGLAVYLIAVGVLFGHLNPHHGGAYHFLGGALLLVGASAFAIGAVGLRGRKASGWLAQVFPLVVVGWVLWDVFSHPAAY